MNNTGLRLAFAGTPELAAEILDSLVRYSPHRVQIVFTRPDKRSGRGKKVTASPVKQLAQKHHLRISQPPAPAGIDPDHELASVEALIVVAFGLILPGPILRRPVYGCLNIHASLLPRWRGAAPVQRAIQAGDRETGVSIMQMDEGLDTGPILAQAQCPIAENETCATLQAKLSVLGAECLLSTLEKLPAGEIVPRPQEHHLATYARKISKAEARLDWTQPAVVLERTIRAFNPAPVAYTLLDGTQLRVWQAGVVRGSAGVKPGTIIACTRDGIDISTGREALRLLRVQPPGKRVMDIGEFLNGRPDFAKKYSPPGHHT